MRHVQSRGTHRRQVDCQRLFDNHGVLIQVVGVLTYNNSPARKFVQTFLLRRQQVRYTSQHCSTFNARQETNKAVQFSLFNDVFRFLKDASVAAPAPAETAAIAVASGAQHSRASRASPHIEPVAETPAVAPAQPEPVVEAAPAPEPAKSVHAPNRYAAHDGRRVEAPAPAPVVVVVPVAEPAAPAAAPSKSAKQTLTYAQRTKEASGAAKAAAAPASAPAAAAVPVVTAVAAAPAVAVAVAAAAPAATAASKDKPRSNANGSSWAPAGSSHSAESRARGRGTTRRCSCSCRACPSRQQRRRWLRTCLVCRWPALRVLTADQTRSACAPRASSSARQTQPRRQLFEAARYAKL